MNDPRDNLPRTREERIKEDYYTMEKGIIQENEQLDYFNYAYFLAWKEARRLEKAKDEER